MTKILPAIAAALLSLAFTACGSNDNPQTLSDKCIAQADNSIALEQNAILGELPSINARNQAACDSLKKLSHEIGKKLVDENADMERRLQFQQNTDSAKSLINNHYTEEFNKTAQQYIGTKIKCGLMESMFSAAEAEITGFRGTKEVEITYTLTTSRQIGRHMRVLFINDQNSLLMPYSLLCKPCKAGTTFTGSTMVPVGVIKDTAMMLFGQ